MEEHLVRLDRHRLVQRLMPLIAQLQTLTGGDPTVSELLEKVKDILTSV